MSEPQSDPSKVMLYMEPKSATPLALLSLCIGALAVMYLVFIANIQSVMEEELGYDPDTNTDELLETVYNKANKAWWMMLSTACVCVLAIFLIFATATFLKGPIGKVAWIVIVLSYITAGFFLGWGAGLLLQPISDLSAAIETAESRGNLTAQQLSNIKSSFKLIGSSSIVLVVICVLGAGVAIGIKKTQ
jgi:hypothetical protein